MKPSHLNVIAAGLFFVLGSLPASGQQWTQYSEIGPTFLGHENTYPDLCKRYDLGLSHEGRHLWAIRISDNVLVEEDEPEFKYIATMHGDEIVGTKMCMNLVEYLLENYGTNGQATNIVDEVELWIVPLMNPDGYDRSPRTRTNAQGIDLNRNFPEGSGPNPDPNTTAGRATETQVIMNWCFGQSATVSANFHTGVVVVNYPFDNDGMGSVFSPTPDEDMFVYISEEYSRYNLPMWNGAWYHGITNGAAWYAISGGMQDWNYRYMGCNEVTIELSNNDQPPASQIPQFWDDNRESMLAYIETALIGVRGIVTDGATGLPVAATVTVVGRDHEVYTDPDVGDYHRMLLPGTYDLVFETAGYAPLTFTDVVVSAGEATRLDVSFGGPFTGLRVTPSTGLDAAGPVGGPFDPASVVYTLENLDSNGIHYSITHTQPWITVVNSSGYLPAYASTNGVVSINTNGNALGSGQYNDAVSFINTTTHEGDTTRDVVLTVGGPAWDPVAYDVEWSTGMNVPTDIPLLGSDPNGDPLVYIIESLASAGDLSDPGAGPITTVPYELVGGGNIVHYEPPPGQNLQVTFDFSVRDATAGSNIATVTLMVGGPSIVYHFPMDSDPGWSTQGLWAFGQPTGEGGEFGGPDPTTGHFGDNVYGYNLNGDYTNNMPVQRLTTPWLDFTGATDVELRFWRWLGVESAYFDHAKVQVSNDPFGSVWTTLWENSTENLWDTEWTEVVLDLSAVADDQSAVSIRWVMGLTDGTNTYCGWNIDDVEIWALVAQPETCEDGIQNQGEDRIDCGGPCPPCDCTSNGECDDELFCTGVETCDAYGECQPGEDPCPGRICDEVNDECMPYADGDYDDDGDVDLVDFGHFQGCLGADVSEPCPCGVFEFVIDGVVDLSDYAQFQPLLSGP